MDAKKMSTVSVYTTDWGNFVIPDEIYKQTKWNRIKVPSIAPDGPPSLVVTEAADCAENKAFFNWLNEQEISAGKPAN